MLKEIQTHDDLKKLSIDQLGELAKGIRPILVETVARRGGHLASNLGAVELELALNYVFDWKKDRLIYDVGHQCYTHKILTGRFERFDTLRSMGGLCGFPSMEEDSRDSFTSGHASTSISAALGFCRARDLRGTDESVVAVIGDGAMTGGMSYEAMNDAGQSRTKLIVVLNDNEMSISQNVGALSRYFSGLRQSRFYSSVKSGTRSFMQRIPLVGKPLFRLIESLRDALRALLIGDNLFDALGFQYVGPVDGHDLKKLIRKLNRAKHAKGPVLLHVVTQKGRGYPPAEQEPERFHGPEPFHVDTGSPVNPPEMTYGKAAVKQLIRMAASDGSICAVTAAMRTGTGLSEFAERYPERFFDVGIAEEHAVTMAGALAVSGLKPYVAIYSTFLQRAYDQIVNDICLNRLPVRLLIDRAGLVGGDGATHNGAFDLSFLRSIPGMTIASPRDADALKRLMVFSGKYDAPLAIRYPKNLMDLGKGFAYKAPVRAGMWEKLMDGEDAMILAVGRMVQTALMCVMELHASGLSVGVVDAMFIKPMDTGMLRELAQSGKALITMEENARMGGFGEGVLDELTQMGLKADVHILALPDRFVPHGTVQQQLSESGLSVEKASQFIREKLQRR